jgi:hypothetical protein
MIKKPKNICLVPAFCPMFLGVLFFISCKSTPGSTSLSKNVESEQTVALMGKICKYEEDKEPNSQIASVIAVTCYPANFNDRQCYFRWSGGLFKYGTAEFSVIEYEKNATVQNYLFRNSQSFVTYKQVREVAQEWMYEHCLKEFRVESSTHYRVEKIKMTSRLNSCEWLNQIENEQVGKISITCYTPGNRQCTFNWFDTILVGNAIFNIWSYERLNGNEIQSKELERSAWLSRDRVRSQAQFWFETLCRD